MRVRNSMIAPATLLRAACRLTFPTHCEMKSHMSKLPLEGMRVIEMGQIVAGPAAGLILAEMEDLARTRSCAAAVFRTGPSLIQSDPAGRIMR